MCQKSHLPGTVSDVLEETKGYGRSTNRRIARQLTNQETLENNRIKAKHTGTASKLFMCTCKKRDLWRIIGKQPNQSQTHRNCKQAFHVHLQKTRFLENAEERFARVSRLRRKVFAEFRLGRPLLFLVFCELARRCSCFFNREGVFIDRESVFL